LFAGIKKRKKNSHDQDGYYWNIEAGLFPTVALYLIIHLIQTSLGQLMTLSDQHGPAWNHHTTNN